MKIIELNGVDYNLPESWNEVTIKKFGELYSVSTLLSEFKSEIEFSLNVWSILLSCPIDELKKITRTAFTSLGEWTTWITEEPQSSGITEWEIDGEKWKTYENLDNLPMGDVISLELMIKESTDYEIIGNIVPILIRRVKTKTGSNGKEKEVMEDFRAEDYKTIREKLINHVPITDVIRLKDFF